MQPSDIHGSFLRAFNRGDVDTVTALYADDAVLVLNGKAVTGRDAIRASYDEVLRRRGTLELGTHSVVRSRDGVALLRGAWINSRGDADGESIDDHG